MPPVGQKRAEPNGPAMALSADAAAGFGGEELEAVEAQIHAQHDVGSVGRAGKEGDAGGNRCFAQTGSGPAKR
jgi:hypothetical protein